MSHYVAIQTFRSDNAYVGPGSSSPAPSGRCRSRGFLFGTSCSASCEHSVRFMEVHKNTPGSILKCSANFLMWALLKFRRPERMAAIAQQPSEVRCGHVVLIRQCFQEVQWGEL